MAINSLKSVLTFLEFTFEQKKSVGGKGKKRNDKEFYRHLINQETVPTSHSIGRKPGCSLHSGPVSIESASNLAST